MSGSRGVGRRVAALRAAHAHYSQRVNAREGWTGHVWQGRFLSCSLNEAHLRAAMHYVEQNPVRAGIGGVAEEYEWRSVGAYCGFGADPLVSGEVPNGVTPTAWQAHLAEPVTEAGIERWRSRTQSGLECGDEGTFSRVSNSVGRALVVRGRGRPRQPEEGDKSAE